MDGPAIEASATGLRERARVWSPAVLLGVATVGAYGTAQYAIGALLPVIAAETGWGLGVLAGGYSLGVLAQGGVAFLAGHEFDRRGSRRVLLTALLLGVGAMLLASVARSAWVFALAWGAGGAAFGGGLYYSMTMPATVRLYPERRASALATLTFIGALAAPIFYPLAAWLIEDFGWRGAIRGLVVLSVACILPAALFVRAPAAVAASGVRDTRRLSEVLRRPAVLRVLLILAVGGMANAALLLHQVAALQAGGLTLAAAGAYAGARGGFQLAGRVLLAPLTRMLGIRGAMTLCYGAAATAAVALLLVSRGTASVLLPWYFAVIGGMSLGLMAPLNGLLQAETYGDEWLGRLNGVSVIVVGTSGAAGAWVAGLVIQATGGFVLVAGAIAVLQCAAMCGLWSLRRYN